MFGSNLSASSTSTAAKTVQAASDKIANIDVRFTLNTPKTITFRRVFMPVSDKIYNAEVQFCHDDTTNGMIFMMA